LLILLATIFVPAEYIMVTALFIMVLGAGIIAGLISSAMIRPIKLWTPIPIRVNNEWCFTYYLTEGSEMISKNEMLHRQLLK